VCFTLLRIVASFLPPMGSPLLVIGAVSLAALAALAWPVWRGIPWPQVRADLGLTWGPRPMLEPAFGLGGYVLSIPIIVVGLLISGLLLYLAGGMGTPGGDIGPVKTPSHPIIPFVAEGGWWQRLQVLLMASVIAPLTEEIFFRGVLYGHLRSATSRLGTAASAAASATISSFVFAALHPQGILLVPGLMGVAFGLCLLRELRGTLVPAMVAHGVHNGLLLSLWMLAMGST
jgi:membrane protease YdiL (CAAX protease family)